MSKIFIYNLIHTYHSSKSPGPRLFCRWHCLLQLEAGFGHYYNVHLFLPFLVMNISFRNHHPRASNHHLHLAKGLSQKNIIIVAVCASVGGAILAFFLVCTIRKLHRSANSNPLPPVQPLSHHREQLAQADDRARTFGSTRLSAYHPSYALSPSGSKVSLIGEQHLGNNNFSSPSSPPSATYQRPGLIVNSGRPLPIPTLHDSLDSSSSLGSTKAELSAHSLSLRAGNLSATAPPFRRPRPLSMLSSQNTFVSRTSRHSVQGMPHSRHSQIQIVLPTPLALVPGNAVDGVDRPNVVDKWMSPSACLSPNNFSLQLTDLVLFCSDQGLIKSGSAYLLISYVIS